MHDAGHGRFAARAHDGCSAGNRTGGRQPPNKAEPRLAAPWAKTSALGRWLPPIIRSATSADKSDDKGRWQKLDNAVEGNRGQLRYRQLIRQGAKA